MWLADRNLFPRSVINSLEVPFIQIFFWVLARIFFVNQAQNRCAYCEKYNVNHYSLLDLIRDALLQLGVLRVRYLV